MKKDQIEGILNDIQFTLGVPYRFIIQERGSAMLLYATYNEPDIDTGIVEAQNTRKWFLSEWATETEIVQTVLKCLLTSTEHRTREAFLYKGKRPFGPHIGIEAHLQACEAVDKRPV